MLTRRSFLLSAPAILLMATSPRAIAAPLTAKYGEGYLDIFPVKSGNPAPVVIYIHGGAWQYGNRRNVDAKPAFFNSLGYCFVSIGYRKVPNVKVETQFQDVLAAIDWVRENISKHGADPRRICLMGHSAGAHLASLAGLKLGPDKVRCVVSNDTRAYDIEAALRSARGGVRSAYERVFPDPAGWPAMSPQNQIGEGRNPAFLVMWSGTRNRDYLQTGFVERLLDAGTDVETYDNRMLSHRKINRRLGTGEVADLDDAVAGFVKRCLP